MTDRRKEGATSSFFQGDIRADNDIDNNIANHITSHHRKLFCALKAILLMKVV